ncbi:uncharacterized protein LOC125858929 [Solanum stenotomum]|uniref:uncharacterized protein LOC125858929 n=1 Tax=Solanum stenotomum TaxID=172797 RepID=UPI0020D06C88|nr:uncharacterized protein LOC125858929 [Solanum stenotomum]
MAKDENVEDMFSRFRKIVCELKSLGMVYSNGLQGRKIVRSLPKAWETKAAILEDGDLQKMTQRPQQDFKNNERNDDRCYYCGKPGHFKQNCPEQRRRNNRRNEDLKSLGAWDQGETSEDGHDEIANICFMALGKTSEVISFNCPNCNDLQDSLDMFTDELQKVIDEYNKIAQEKKDWQILLEASQIEVDILTEELEEVKMQLDSIRKSPSHSSVRSNTTAFNRRRSPNQSSNRSISNSPYHSAENSVNFSCYTYGDIGHKSFNCRKFSSGKWIWRSKVVNLTLKDPKILGYQKEINLLVLQEQTKRAYKKGMWVINSGCSRHMIRKKENFKTLYKNDGGYAQIRENAKGEVVGVGSITLSS